MEFQLPGFSRNLAFICSADGHGDKATIRCKMDICVSGLDNRISLADPVGLSDIAKHRKHITR